MDKAYVSFTIERYTRGSTYVLVARTPRARSPSKLRQAPSARSCSPSPTLMKPEDQRKRNIRGEEREEQDEYSAFFGVSSSMARATIGKAVATLEHCRKQSSGSSCSVNGKQSPTERGGLYSSSREGGAVFCSGKIASSSRSRFFTPGPLQEQNDSSRSRQWPCLLWHVCSR